MRHSYPNAYVEAEVFDATRADEIVGIKLQLRSQDVICSRGYGRKRLNVLWLVVYSLQPELRAEKRFTYIWYNEYACIYRIEPLRFHHYRYFRRPHDLSQI